MPVALSLLAGGILAALDAVFVDRIHAGTDAALRLSVILPYVGVDGSYALARAFGLTALAFAAASVTVGIHQRVRRLTGALTLPWHQTVHRQLGVLTVALVGGHLVAPFASPVPPYGGWLAVLVPFTQPAQWGARTTLLLSAGVVAFWLLVFLGPAYLLLGRRRRWWSAVHAFTVVAYGLAVAHAFWLGSDLMVRGPARVAVLAAQVPVTALLGRWLVIEARRLAGAGGRGWATVALTGAAAAVAGSGALAVLASMGAAGMPVGGLRL